MPKLGATLQEIQTNYKVPTPPTTTPGTSPVVQNNQIAAKPLTPLSPMTQVPDTKRKFLQGSWFDKLIDVTVGAPYYAYSGFLKGTEQERSAQRASGTYDPLKRLGAGIRNIIPGIQNRTEISANPGDVNVAKDIYNVQNPTAAAAGNFGLSLAVPSLPIGKVLSPLTKVAKYIPGVEKASNLISKAGGKVMDFARNTPQIAQPIEKLFDPFFSNPELGGMVKNLQETLAKRYGGLERTVRTAMEGLSPAERVRAGHILEGGTALSTNSQKLQKVIQPIRELADSVGKELVDQGVLTAESYNKYKGQYMRHIWEDMLLKKGVNVKAGQSIIPSFTNAFAQKRKGAEGYIKEFQVPTFLGLGEEIKASELAKFYKQVAEKFGTGSPQLKRAEDIVTSTLQKFAKEPSGLSLMEKNISKPGWRTPNQLTQELVDTLKNRFGIIPSGKLSSEALSEADKSVLYDAKYLIQEAARSGDEEAAQALYKEFSNSIKLPSLKSIIDEGLNEERAILDSVKAEMAANVGNYDDPTNTLVRLAQKISDTIRTPGGVFKVAGKGKLGSDMKSAMDNLAYATDISGFSLNVEKLAQKYGGGWSEINDIIKSGDIDGGDYEQFKTALSNALSAKRGVKPGGFGATVQDSLGEGFSAAGKKVGRLSLKPVIQSAEDAKQLESGITAGFKLKPTGKLSQVTELEKLPGGGVSAVSKTVDTRGFPIKAKVGKVGQLPEPNLKTPILKPKSFRNIPEGFSYAPEELSKAKGAGLLKDVALPDNVIRLLKSSIGSKGESNALVQVFDKLMTAWKAGKTIWNVPYHIRNSISNQILADWKTGSLSTAIPDYFRAVRDYVTKGKHSQFFEEAISNNLIKRSNYTQTLQELVNPEIFNQKGILRRIFETPGNIQKFSEDTAKLQVYTNLRSHGASIDEAIKGAEEAIFSPYRISEQERSIVGKAVPFYSFTRQALPYTVKTALTHPERLATYPKLETAVESLSSDQTGNEKYLPEWMRGMTRLPSKDKQGNQEYAQLKYFYPYGNFGDENSGAPFGLSWNPALSEGAAQAYNKDLYFNREIASPADSSNKQKLDRLTHAAYTFLPSGVRSLFGKIIPALQGQPDYAGRQRDLGNTLLGDVGAIKKYGFDVSKGRKTYNYTVSQIRKEAQQRISFYRKDKSLSPEQRQKNIDGVLKQMKERIAKLGSGQ